MTSPPSHVTLDNEIFRRKWPQNWVDVFCSPDDRIGHVTYIMLQGLHMEYSRPRDLKWLTFGKNANKKG